VNATVNRVKQIVFEEVHIENTEEVLSRSQPQGDAGSGGVCHRQKKKTNNKDNDTVRALTMPLVSHAFKLIHSNKSHFEWKGMK